MKVGIGYDLHKLVSGRPFIMGGVIIESEFGPEGHSDGDALCHAIADALLGAACLGDIGLWFPPDDPKFKDADSLKLLARICAEVHKKGYKVGNVDSVLICEKPKISPHYPEMRRRIAAAMGISEDQVSVKATTNEKLGEIGSGQAVAAQAIALLESL